MKKKNNLNNIVINLFIIIFSIVIFITTFLIVKENIENKKSKLEVKEFIIDKKVAIKEQEPKEEVNKEKTVLNNSDTEYNIYDLNMYRDKYNNKDIVGILSIPNTRINTLLLQSDNNEYYLRRLPNKKQHITGSVFIDYRTKINDNNIVIIYGHNASNYDIPFRYLTNYLDEQFYKNNKHIYIYTDEGSSKYEIFSVYETENDYEHTNINYSTEENFLKHLNVLKDKSIYSTYTSLSSSDDIIILQTCMLRGNSLLIICAKKI